MSSAGSYASAGVMTAYLSHGRFDGIEIADNC